MTTRIKTKKVKAKTRKRAKANFSNIEKLKRAKKAKTTGKERRPDGLIVRLGRSQAGRCDLL
jgi:hypothetical protein